MKVYSAGAHAHYLARQMIATATLPDGSTRSLLRIKDWDFNWQDGYVYKQPFTLPKGTRIDATITYDNSAENPRNPISPPRRAVFGEQSFDEMGAVLLDFEVMNKADKAAFEEAIGLRVKEAIQVAGKNGTLGRFLARANRERAGRQQLTVLDRGGAVMTRVADPAFLQHAAMSPDGKQVAVLKVDSETGNEDIWIYDVATGTGRALTSDEARDMTPVWSADGRSIAFVSVRENTYGIYRRAVDGKSAEERLYLQNTGATIFLTDWSADGKLLTFWSNDDLFVMPLTGDRTLARSGERARWTLLARWTPARIQRSRAAAGPVPRLRAAARCLVCREPRRFTESDAETGVDRQRDRRNLLEARRARADVHVAAAEAIGHGGGRDAAHASGVESGTPRVLFALPPGVGGPAQLSSVATPDGERFVFALSPPRPAPAQAQTR